MLKNGQILNDTYRVIEQIGSGGGGTVFKAYHLRLEKYVAVKLINDNVKSDTFNRSEVDMLKNLKNDYLPQVIDFVEDGSDVYTAMEFIEGSDFRQLIESGKSFSEKQVRKYALQLCEAVKYLHNHVPPIIHSDIKPANIMLTPQDNICLIDFNISTFSNNGEAESIGFSRDFCAPEQFKKIIKAPTSVDEFHEETRFVDNDETEILLECEMSVPLSPSRLKTKNAARAFIDVRTDIYGIGASVYYMLTGRVPTAGRTDFRGIKCSAQIREAIEKAMNVNPAKRFNNVSALANAFKKRISGKKILLPVSVTLAALLLVCGVILSANNSSESEIVYENISESEGTGEQSSEAKSDESEETTESTDQNDYTEYYDFGGIRCEKTNENSDGSYDLTWYEPNGAIDFVEQYDPNGAIINLVRYDSFTGEVLGEATPELIDGGYTFIVYYSDRDYSYIKSFFDLENHTVYKREYYDENDNLLVIRLISKEYNSNGSFKYIHRNSDGNIVRITNYNADNTVMTVEAYKNNRLDYIKTTYKNGEEEITYYDESGNTISETTSETTAAGTVAQSEQKPETKSIPDYIIIKGKIYSTDLTEFSLPDAGLSDSDIKDLKYMTKLEKLELQGNNISNISFLANLKKLKTLKLSYNNIVDFSAVAGLKSLEYLKISGNNISNLSFVSGLINLKELVLCDNNVSDISCLKYMKNLESLDFRANNVSDISVLSELPNLSEVHLYKNPIVNFEPIKEQNNLAVLWIDKNQLQGISALSEYKNAKIWILDDVDKDTLYDVKFTLPDCEVGTFTDPWAEVYGY